MSVLEKPIIETLKAKLPKIGKKFPNINYGGCGKFAIMLGEELIERKHKFEYVMLITTSFNKDIDVDKKKNCFQNNSDKPLKILNTKYSIYCAHIMVRIGGVVVDSDGVFKSPRAKKSNYMELGTVSHKTLSKWIDEPYVWNNIFLDNHHREIYDIELSIKELFN